MEQRRVSRMPHSIYRYPARFSPEFAREAILTFTRAGDLVIDPFAGGGTSIAEAISMGRRAAGIDISALATFLARVKTTPLSSHDAAAVLKWAQRLPNAAKFRILAVRTTKPNESYLRHLSPDALLFFRGLLSRVERIPNRRQQRFVRMILLASSQAALDCKTDEASLDQLLTDFRATLISTISQFTSYWRDVANACALQPSRLTKLRRIVNRSCLGADADKRIPREWLPARLILTSPPYPGVHVLYHRWQIRGRRETPVAFWIAGEDDGAGEAYYTFGPRQQAGLPRYFAQLRSTFSSIRRFLNEQSIVVQLVGFSKPDWQLPIYLRTMEVAGFQELMPICNRDALYQGRVWRRVPGRRWYACIDDKTESAREVLLLHRIAN
jgi:hypothetical protein